jgi:predicted NBD/HSP70 family sugar kinase
MATGRADQNLIRRLNSALILDQLLVSSPQSRANLAQQTGLNRSTISSLVNNLLCQGLIREVGPEAAESRGRPGILLELNPRGGCIVGIEISVNYISAILTDFTAHTLWRRQVEFAEGMPQADVLVLAEDLIHAALRAGSAHQLRPLGIGIGAPGLVDGENRVLVYAPNLRWHHVSFQDLWGQKFGVPLYIENDGNASALGEYYFGVAKGCRNFIYLGTGIGLAGGLMLNGQLYQGANGYAGEVGHITVTATGDLCNCGRRGCWEMLVGSRAVIQGIVQALDTGASSGITALVGGDLGRITMSVVAEAANQDDPLALAALADVAHYLGIGIANLINLFNPELIVLGGMLIPVAEYLMPTISRRIAAEALSDPARSVALALSSQGSDVCVKGAVALVIDRIVREPGFC